MEAFVFQPEWTFRPVEHEVDQRAPKYLQGEADGQPGLRMSHRVMLEQTPREPVGDGLGVLDHGSGGFRMISLIDKEGADKAEVASEEGQHIVDEESE